MLILIIQLLLPFILVAAVYRLDSESKFRKQLSKMFWQEIFDSYENDDKQGIKMFRFYVRAIIMFYLYSNFTLIVSAVLYLSPIMILIAIINMLMIPLMFRFVFSIQRKLWKID